MSYEYRKKMVKGDYVSEKKETVAEVNKLPFADYPERGIRKEVYEKFGVRMALSTTDRSVEAIYFPYYNEDGKLTGYKKRDLTLDKYDTGHFTVVGKVGIQNKLFGQQVAESIKRPKKKLFLVEGEWDVLSSYQACVDTLEGTKYAGMEPFVVGLSCGTGNAKAAVSVNLDFVESFEVNVLGFDNDEATPEEAAKKIKKGKEATEDVGLLITKSQVMVAEYKDFHDPNDYVKAGKYKELANALSFATKKFTADKVVTADSLSFEELVKPRVQGVNIPQFPELMSMTGGCRTRELWCVCGPSGVGKSFVCSTIAAELRLAGHRVGMIFLEEELKETVLRMVAHKCKVNYNKVKFDPLKYVSEEEMKEAYEWVKEDDVFKVVSVHEEHWGTLVKLEGIFSTVNITHLEHVKESVMDNTDDAMNNSEEKEINWELGQEVFCLIFGKGKVDYIDKEKDIGVFFEKNRGIRWYTSDGKYFEDTNRTLFFSEPQIIAEKFPPKKPFTPTLKEGDVILAKDYRGFRVIRVSSEDEHFIYNEDGTGFGKSVWEFRTLGEEIIFK